jgi:hypothetical protein
MPVLQISVDGQTRSGPSGPQNWGELLDLIENGTDSGRRVVTAVRINGVAEPTFRAAHALTRGLADLGAIDVVTASRDDLLRESAQAACESLAPLARATRRLAERLRGGHEMTAARDLPALTMAVQTLTTITAGLGAAPRCRESHRSDCDALVLRLCWIVDAIVSHRVNADWRGVADVLDRELAPTLEAWASVIRRVWKIA